MKIWALKEGHVGEQYDTKDFSRQCILPGKYPATVCILTGNSLSCTTEIFTTPIQLETEQYFIIHAPLSSEGFPEINYVMPFCSACPKLKSVPWNIDRWLVQFMLYVIHCNVALPKCLLYSPCIVTTPSCTRRNIFLMTPWSYNCKVKLYRTSKV